MELLQNKYQSLWRDFRMAYYRSNLIIDDFLFKNEQPTLLTLLQSFKFTPKTFAFPSDISCQLKTPQNKKTSPRLFINKFPRKQQRRVLVA